MNSYMELVYTVHFYFVIKCDYDLIDILANEIVPPQTTLHNSCHNKTLLRYATLPLYEGQRIIC